jgi:multimeric flavodoxin WrbA
MKAICIIGSPHANGSTMQVTEHMKRGLSAVGIDCTMYLLNDLHIAYCQGCESCVTSTRCMQRDDMDILIPAMLSADIVIIASPSYWGDITAQLKTFIDRCMPLADTRPTGTIVPPGKRGVAVAVRAGNSPGENKHIIATLHHFFAHLGITPVADLTFEGIHTPADLSERQTELQQAYEIGCRVGEELIGD